MVETKACDHCSTPFERKYKGQLYCSQSCRFKTNHMRDAEKKRARREAGPQRPVYHKLRSFACTRCSVSFETHATVAKYCPDCRHRVESARKNDLKPQRRANRAMDRKSDGSGKRRTTRVEVVSKAGHAVEADPWAGWNGWWSPNLTEEAIARITARFGPAPSKPPPWRRVPHGDGA
jgi:uncharacterized Zn finger protein (UPF0148 family)